MNLLALFVGLITAMTIIGFFSRPKAARKRIVYPLLLGSFPLYYVVFAIAADDYSALWLELAVGMVFFVLVWIALQLKSKQALLLTAMGCGLHAVYDVGHNTLFINQGTPLWWSEFCLMVDAVLCVYLIYIALRLPATVSQTSPSESLQ